MKTYEIVVRVTLTKTYTVDAESKDEAIEELFSAGIDLEHDPHVPEYYDEEILSIAEI